MKNIAVVGTGEFTLGFKLAGINEVVIIEENDEKTIKSFLGRSDLGIVIVDEKVMEKLSPLLHQDIIQSLQPVFVVLSVSGKEDGLREMIMQSIGVDLLKE